MEILRAGPLTQVPACSRNPFKPPAEAHHFRMPRLASQFPKKSA